MPPSDQQQPPPAQQPPPPPAGGDQQQQPPPDDQQQQQQPPPPFRQQQLQQHQQVDQPPAAEQQPAIDLADIRPIIVLPARCRPPSDRSTTTDDEHPPPYAVRDPSPCGGGRHGACGGGGDGDQHNDPQRPNPLQLFPQINLNPGAPDPPRIRGSASATLFDNMQQLRARIIQLDAEQRSTNSTVRELRAETRGVQDQLQLLADDRYVRLSAERLARRRVSTATTNRSTLPAPSSLSSAAIAPPSSSAQLVATGSMASNAQLVQQLQQEQMQAELHQQQQQIALLQQQLQHQQQMNQQQQQHHQQMQQMQQMQQIQQQQNVMAMPAIMAPPERQPIIQLHGVPQADINGELREIGHRMEAMELRRDRIEAQAWYQRTELHRTAELVSLLTFGCLAVWFFKK